MDTEIPTMFGLALLSVSLWTFRVSITARGLKLASAVMAAVEAVIYVLSFYQLITDIGSPGRVLGYGAGVAVGTALGLVLDDKTSRGHTELHLVTQGDRADLVRHSAPDAFWTLRRLQDVTGSAPIEVDASPVGR